MLAIATATFTATLTGGLVGLRFREHLHRILGFSGGALVGVALFDLLPEAIELGGVPDGQRLIPIAVALGFTLHLVLDRLLGGGAGSCVPGATVARTPRTIRGPVGAASLSLHSLLDGLAIGAAYQASPRIGFIVALAVILHDASDGLNTVNVVLRNGASRRTAVGWLLADAVAPVIGILLSFLVALPPRELGLALALFAGVFLYLGASDLIPESVRAEPGWSTTALTLLGLALMLAVTQLSSI